MSIIENLIQKWKKTVNGTDPANHPAIPLAIESIQRVWVGNELSQDFSKEFVDNIADQMMQEVMKIVSSPNPFMHNRERLAASVLELAEYMTLVAEPEPAPDVTGFRGAPISGELKSRLWRLRTIKNNQKIWEGSEVATITSLEDLWSLIQTKYKTSLAWAELFQSLRPAFEKLPDQGKPDWYRPFIQSMCANKEHHFRLSLKMPSILDPDPARANMISLEHSLFFNLVRHGLENPLEAWKAAVDHIEYGDDQATVYNLYAEQYPI